jgi:hypothetical protein
MAPQDDMRFVYEQACRFVQARPWEPDLQRAGIAEPPAGSIFVELLNDPEPEAVAFVRERGWPDAGQEPADPNIAEVHAIFECLSQAN